MGVFLRLRGTFPPPHPPHPRGSQIVAHGGTKVAGPFDADGTVCIVRDPAGAPFAVYHRTDDPGVTKPGTSLWDA